MLIWFCLFIMCCCLFVAWLLVFVCFGFGVLSSRLIVLYLILFFFSFVLYNLWGLIFGSIVLFFCLFVLLQFCCFVC